MALSTVTVTEKTYAFLNVHKIQKKLRRGFHKLIKKKVMLVELVERMDIKHPLAALFLGIIEGKLGNSDNASTFYELAQDGLAASEYWRLRFQALGVALPEKTLF